MSSETNIVRQFNFNIISSFPSIISWKKHGHKHFQCDAPFPFQIFPMKTIHQKRLKPNPVLMKIKHHCHQVFPTASCSSRDIGDDDADEGSGDLNLPGFQRKPRNKLIDMKSVGEYEINQLVQSETGWDRVRQMYKFESGKFQDEGTNALNTILYRTVIIGFFINAIVESSKHNKAEKSLSRTETLRKAGVSKVLIPKEVLQTALKDTFRLSIITVSLFHLSQTIAAYRNKTSIWEYIISSVIGFGALGIPKGVTTFGIYSVRGALFGSIGGYIACNVLQNAGLTQEMRTMKRMERRIEELRMQPE